MGATVNAFSCGGIPWRYDWSQDIQQQAGLLGVSVVRFEQLTGIVEAKQHILIDARPRQEYALGHLPLALSLPATDFDQAFVEVASILDPHQLIVVYCSSQACDASLQVARLLREQGFAHVSVFPDGYEAWAKAGLEVEHGY